jgi:transcriptional regulator with XRE-family HTH domain
MLKRINDLADPESGYTAGNMPVTWDQVRAQFLKEWLPRKERGLTQKAAAGPGGHQSTISKLEHDPKFSPNVKTFLAVLEGLGVDAAEFFSRAEGLRPPREGDKTDALPVGRHAKSTAVPDLRTFALDLVDALQDLVAKYDAAERGERPPRKTHRKAAPPRQAAAGKTPRA